MRNIPEILLNYYREIYSHGWPSSRFYLISQVRSKNIHSTCSTQRKIIKTGRTQRPEVLLSLYHRLRVLDVEASLHIAIIC